MTETDFWQLVTRSHAEQTEQALVEQLQQGLEPLDNESLKAFDKFIGQQLRRSYTWDLWGAAYIITGCDSDYAFAEFRCFLLSLGQEWYEKVLAEPDALGELTTWPLKDNYAYPFVEDLDLIAGKLYEDRTGKELPFVPSGTKTPAGKKFSTKAKVLKQTYPKLAQQFPF
ncbi:DUF4240 domain-containing protein [Shewanella gaetbuli]|uniref:DUF4240 domain-containing protein n=1 Tax=Shewanella gaetbuli TaxID=220752 RepID=A0A9X1ZS48_9GAMM|nr:DUF4240 domain-containing protein [Shewanella gaetbuli]MCL1141171.1 DUF4240 domain-containing protein [Shewanella gaetbuli]